MITLFCPSRGRPDSAKALLKSFSATKAGDAQLVFLVDDDDKTLPLYPGHLIVAPGTGDPTGPLNRAVMSCPSEIVGFIGDDSRCASPGWDVQVEKVLETPGFCWGDDGHNVPWPSTVFVSRAIVQSLGYLAPPFLHRGYFDEAWVRLSGVAENWRVLPTNCARVLDVSFPHDNSKGVVPPEVIAADRRAYLEWYGSPQFQADRMKVMAVTGYADLVAALS